ncbi:aminoglycoside N(3)-acetyltransferase [Pseudoalteromonas rubra]|uniref:Aminoglycoside N(3)-acetyltransferase n=1 Tax=Pseudoalteromonas rubra TaxID=43658 RepID=A0A5S3UXL0_9GAMM|nr:AAC(3) family N-acetyltransferase [Pseudoalteromonas rubra]QPB82641.1 aminoglycoside N(3)-acetyltransferase [Pseudoalteromonas rubra]
MQFYDFLTRALRTGGVTQNATLIVHSAFRPLAQHQVDPAALCETLVEHCKTGNVIMPTMSWRTVTPQNPVFDWHKTRSHTGVMTELFRTQFATHRSLHPTHSVAAIGRDAYEITAAHHLDPGPCSVHSPYGIIENSALRDQCYILHLGVALESCTYIHHFEEMFAPEIYLAQNLENYTLVDKSGNPSEYRLHRHTKRVRDFHQFGSRLHRSDGIHVFHFGQYDVTLVNVSVLSHVVKQAFASSSHATLAPYSYMERSTI